MKRLEARDLMSKIALWYYCTQNPAPHKTFKYIET
jgi:hypothetical protein